MRPSNTNAPITTPDRRRNEVPRHDREAVGSSRTKGVFMIIQPETTLEAGAAPILAERTRGRKEAQGGDRGLGGRNPLRRLLRVLAPTGTLVIVGGEGGNRVTGGAGRQLRGLLLSPFVRPRLRAFISREHHESMDALARHLADGSVVPAIGARWDLAQVPAALRALESGVTSGKSLVLVDDTDADPATA